MLLHQCLNQLHQAFLHQFLSTASDSVVESIDDTSTPVSITSKSTSKRSYESTSDTISYLVQYVSPLPAKKAGVR